MKESNDKPVSDKKKRGRVLLLIGSLLWLPVSFILPFSFTNHMASQNYFADVPGRSVYAKQPAQWRIDAARSEALRSGVLGVTVALSIFLMWRLDRVLAKDGNELKGAWMVVMLGAFAMLLWTVWTCAGHLMIRANDEINATPAQLPGLESPN